MGTNDNNNDDWRHRDECWALLLWIRLQAQDKIHEPLKERYKSAKHVIKYMQGMSINLFIFISAYYLCKL